MAKLKWGMIGGGEGSQIGPSHRLGSGIDGEFEFVAGALDHRPEEGRAYGQKLGLDADRSYGNWQEMLEGERNRREDAEVAGDRTRSARAKRSRSRGVRERPQPGSPGPSACPVDTGTDVTAAPGSATTAYR